MKPNLFGDPASREASTRQLRDFERRREERAKPPGPPEPPRVPGHMGYPRAEVIRAARVVFGVLDILAEDDMDVTELRRSWLRELERTGLREADLRRRSVGSPDEC
jgi:hypothetical protein